MRQRASMIVISHLSDVQEMNGFKMIKSEQETEKLNDIHHRVNFAKFIIGECDGDLNKEIDPDELWAKYKKAYPNQPYR